MDNISGNIENNTENCLNCRCLVQEISEERNISEWPRDDECDILVKNVNDFSSSLKNLPEAKLKSLGLMALAQEISTQPSIDYVIWLSVATLIHIWNEKEKSEQGTIQNIKFEGKKGAPGILMLKLNSVFKVIKCLKKTWY